MPAFTKYKRCAFPFGPQGHSPVVPANGSYLAGATRPIPEVVGNPWSRHCGLLFGESDPYIKNLVMHTIAE